MRRIAATRTLKNGRRRVVVSVGVPTRVAREEWACPYSIAELNRKGQPRVQNARGLDGMQALLLAFECVRMELERSGMALTWEGGERGDAGFPRLVPTYFGLDFQRKLSGVIDREVERFSRAAKRKSLKARPAERAKS